ncbi:MAG TPA: CHAT domain-containing tetratricopeptide repeat protein [Gemmatimonadaceae bacterium]|nr:CHAT domain-containing tetratricopeptide repeat protein [Gemmatimonadaceae bacterium]
MVRPGSYRCFVLSALAACAPPARERPSVAESAVAARQVGSSVRAIGTVVDSLLALGDSVYRESPDRARRAWSSALSLAKAERDSGAMARALTGLGQTARQFGNYEEARRLGEQALGLKLRLHMNRELARSYNALGLLAWDEERLADASSLLDSAILTAHASGDSLIVVKAMNNAGLVAQDLGAFGRAREAFIGARDAAIVVHDSVTLARSLTDLAALDVPLGDPVSAIESLDAARRIARALRDSTTDLNALGQLATAYDALGEPQRSFSLLDSALVMARRAGQRQEEAEDLTILADLYLDAGDYTHALAYYQRALVATDSLGRPEERGNILRSEARVHAALGNVPLASQDAYRAYEIHRSGGFAYPALADAIVLSTLSQQRGDPGDADRYLGDARSIATRLQAPVAGARVGIAEAEIAVARRDWARARRALQRAAGTLTLAGSSAEAQAMTLSARAFEGLGQLDSALAAGRRAVAAVERVRGNYASGELRTTYVADRASVYATQVLLLLRMGRTAEAFQVADAARGRALVEHLSAARRDVSVGAGAAPDLAREDLLRRIDALVAKLAGGESRPPRERSPTFVSLTGTLRDSLLAARAEYEALTARAGADTATGGGGAGGVASESELARSLAPGEALVEYLVTSERLIVFVVSAHGLTVKNVPERAVDLRSRVQLARALVQRRDVTSAARGVLTALYQILIEPAAETGALQGVRTLVIVPHGPLSYLPFSALIDPRSGRYAAEEYAFLRVPTAASLPRLREATRARSTAFRPFRVDVFAPFPDSLAATREEAQSVHRLSRGGRVYLGTNAVKSKLRESLEAGAVVHVASHARMNSRNPLFSDIELAASERERAEGYDRLEVHELLAMHVQSPLVFLSGCETALGASWSTGFDMGEDYTTIAQTFLYAGALDVVATLWRIDDEGAAAFAAHFYARLAHGTVAEALAQAQRDLMADSRYESPYYWAAYELTGGGTPQIMLANRTELSDQRR